jgi:uncharacterized Zn-finger protein
MVIPQHHVIQPPPSNQGESCDPCCAQPVYKITRADLPLSCPSQAMCLWNGHPRVYLPIEQTGRAQCPYCGARYELVDGDEAA